MSRRLQNVASIQPADETKNTETLYYHILHSKSFLEVQLEYFFKFLYAKGYTIAHKGDQDESISIEHLPEFLRRLFTLHLTEPLRVYVVDPSRAYPSRKRLHLTLGRNHDEALSTIPFCRTICKAPRIVDDFELSQLSTMLELHRFDGWCATCTFYIKKIIQSLNESDRYYEKFLQQRRLSATPVC